VEVFVDVLSIGIGERWTAAPRGARTPLVLAAAGLLGAAALVAGMLWLPLGSEPPSVMLRPPGPPASGPMDGPFESMLVGSRPLWLALAAIVMLLLITLRRRRARSRKRLDDASLPVRRSGAPQTDSPTALRCPSMAAWLSVLAPRA
jgi:hypothetical protein